MNKALYIFSGLISILIVAVGLLSFVLYDQSKTTNQIVASVEQNKALQEQDMALVLESFRQLQEGLQIENSELETLLQKQEQQFLTQIQDIERQKEISERLLSQDNKELAQNISDLSEKLVELETVSKPALIAKWSDVTLKIECYFDSGKKTFGSGMYIGENSNIDFGAGNDHVILSNSHVLEEDNEVPTRCEIQWNSGFVTDLGITENTISYFQDLDAAYITLNPSDVPATILALTESFDQCALNPTSGDELIILGYPKIGSTEGITSTEGIVSGYDDEFIITSAKISRGNSGGLAIVAERDCYIGIPTLARVDEVESLGRILIIDSLFE